MNFDRRIFDRQICCDHVLPSFNVILKVLALKSFQSHQNVMRIVAVKICLVFRAVKRPQCSYRLKTGRENQFCISLHFDLCTSCLCANTDDVNGNGPTFFWPIRSRVFYVQVGQSTRQGSSVLVRKCRGKWKMDTNKYGFARRRIYASLRKSKVLACDAIRRRSGEESCQ